MWWGLMFFALVFLIAAVVDGFTDLSGPSDELLWVVAALVFINEARDM